jgi:hypothetical protein
VEEENVQPIMIGFCEGRKVKIENEVYLE